MALGGTGRIPATASFAAFARLSARERRVTKRALPVRMDQLSQAAARGGLSAIRRVGQGTFQTWPMPASSKGPALSRAFYKNPDMLTQAQAAGIRLLLARRILGRA
jgi:hypothetical protein